MPSICLYLQVHQPFRIIRTSKKYFDNSSDNEISNKKIFLKVCKKSYLPAGRIILCLLKKYPEFKLSLSFSGLVLEQMEKYSPETLSLFQKIVKTKRVEILSETFYHSLAFFYSRKEFEIQVELHRKKVAKLFQVRPKVFRNTELAYTDNLADWAFKKGYLGVLTEGWEKYLNDNSPNFLSYCAKQPDLKILLRNYKFSDNVAFLFSERRWEEWPLNAAKFAGWLSESHGETINLFMDFETFGEHQWKETGIFTFLEDLPMEVLKKRNLNFKTATEIATDFPARFAMSVPGVLTWADSERDLSAWIGNRMQQKAIKSLYRLESKVLKTKNPRLVDIWRKLQTSDHFYYMCTKQFEDGGVHEYFSPFDTPRLAYENFMSALGDFQSELEKRLKR